MTLNCLLTRSQSACETFGYGSTGSSPFAWPLPSAAETGRRSMYTRRKRCLPIFHSTSTTSSPSERATLSAASRIFSNCKQRLPSLCRFHAHSNRPTKKWACAHPVVRPVTERNQSICPGQDKSKAQGPRAIHGHLKRNRVPSGTFERDAKKPQTGRLRLWRRSSRSRLRRGGSRLGGCRLR